MTFLNNHAIQGGFIEHVLTHADVLNVVDKYLKKCKDLGFDVVELSSGFLSFPPDDWLRLIEKVHHNGLIAKPELGIQFGAGGDTSAAELETAGQSDPFRVVSLGKKFLADRCHPSNPERPPDGAAHV